jgi:pimeloyl-ACP methyl ester carboxylesterase
MKLLKRVAIVALGVLALLAVAGYFYLDKKPDGLPERHGRVSSELFAGDQSKQPLIVGLGGAEGGNPWASQYWKPQRERFLAEGYAFLAIGYFGTPESPAQLDRIALEGVHAAVLAAAQDPRIDGQCIVIMGGSKGAELALELASRYKAYRAVVALVGGSAVFPALTPQMNTSSWSMDGKELAFVPVPWSATGALLTGDLRAAFQKMMDNTQAMSDAAIRVEDIAGPVLFMSATRDEFWPSTEMSAAMVQRMKVGKFAHHIQHEAVDGTHAAPLKHFDIVEQFLANHVKGALHSCRTPALTFPSSPA